MKNGLAGYQFSGEPESSGTGQWLSKVFRLCTERLSSKTTNAVKAKRENVKKFTTQYELLTCETAEKTVIGCSHFTFFRSYLYNYQFSASLKSFFVIRERTTNCICM